MKILVIAPHPDDEVLGCGGAIARSVSEGVDVHVVILTRGVPELFPPEQIDGTRLELQQAHARLGVGKCHFLDFPAPRTDAVPFHLVADGIRSIVRLFEPDTVYIPHHGDLHHEHGIAHTASLVACRPTHTSVKRILAYETLSETDWAPPRPDTAFIPNVYLDISRHLDAKLEAMQCYASQLHAEPSPRSISALKALACLRGSTIGVVAAEAFVLIREIA